MQNNSNCFLDESLAVSWGSTAYNVSSTVINAIGSIFTGPLQLIQDTGTNIMMQCADIVDRSDQNTGKLLGAAVSGILSGTVGLFALGAKKIIQVVTKAAALTAGTALGAFAFTAGVVANLVRYGGGYFSPGF